MKSITLAGGPGDGKQTVVQLSQGLFMWPVLGGCQVYVIHPDRDVATYDGYEPWVDHAVSE